MTTMTNNTQPVNSKERKNGNEMATKTVAAATVVAASAGAGVLADELYRDNALGTQEGEPQGATVTATPQETAETSQEAQDAQAAEQPAPQAAAHNAAQQHHEPQPIDHSEGADVTASNETTSEISTVEGPINTDDLANVDPNIVSADIASTEFIDENDNDAANLPIASVGSIETADGDTLAAAALITDSGETMYLVDVNHDNQYDVITNEQGTAVAEVPGTITTSDGYELAHLNNGHQDEYQGDNENANDDNGTDIDNDMENNIIEVS